MNKKTKIILPSCNELSIDDDYEKMKSYFHDNLLLFMETNHLSSGSLAKTLNCSDKTIESYSTSKKVADPKILGKLKTSYDISLDDFLFRKMSREELIRDNRNVNATTYYNGLYIIYYLDTEEFKGSDQKEASESLQYGILYIYENEFHKSSTNLECVATLGIEDKKEALDLYNTCQRYIKLKNISSLLSSLETHKYNRFYHGQFIVDKEHYYLTMSHLYESVLMIGYSINEKDDQEYIGGLVTVNSISRGRENTPVLQLAGLSRYFLKCNDEELETALHMRYRIEIGDEAERILEFIRNPLSDSAATKEHPLTEDQLKAIITADIEYELRRLIEKRVYRHYKMPPFEDSLFYHYLMARCNGPKRDHYGQGKY